MATEQEVAEMIKAGNYGQPPPQEVAQVAPDMLLPNPPDMLATAPSDVVIPQVDPAMAAAAQQADAQQASMTQNLMTPPIPEGGISINDALNPLQPPKAYVEQQKAQQEAQLAQSEPEMPAPMTEAAPNVAPEEQKHQEIVAPVREAIAENRAIKTAQKDLQAEFAKQQEDLQQQQDEIKRQINTQDDAVRVRSLPEIMQRGNFGDKLGATIALLVGGLSQGLTGAKSNPVLDFLDKQADAQAARDKLSAEGKMALKKSLLDVAQLQMQNQANKSQDLFHKQSIQQEAAKLVLEKQKIEGEQAIAAATAVAKRTAAETAHQAEMGGPIADLSALTEDQRKRVVRLPDGSHRLATVGPDQVDAFAKQRAELEPGIAGINRITALTHDFNRVTDLKKRAQIGSEIKALTGSLRVPFTGPGALTAKEYDRLLDVVGDPNSILAIPALQMARLHQVQTKLQSDLNSGFKRIGVDVPLTVREQLMQKFSK